MAAIDAKEKLCKRCNRLKSTADFYKHSQRGSRGQVWYYFDSMCKKCRIEYSVEMRRAVRTRAIEYLGGVCSVCGEKYINDVFDFHHPNGDGEYSISNSGCRRWERVKKELDKCVLVCSNCHRIIHAKKPTAQ